MIVITNPIAVANEISLIHSLFAEGLSLLHIRKPDFSEAEMKTFLSAIGWEVANRLVLHSHHHLGNEYGINRFHLSKAQRNTTFIKSDGIYSASTHSIKEFNDLNQNFQHAFLSPIYKSISKTDYDSKINHFQTLEQRTNFATKLVALGGLSSENIQETLENGFDEIALLGTVWNSKNPLENFKKCQQIVHSF
ncbi:thiamine monophosphate synthase [Flavobacterium saliperosum S13]|uniref:Thiamine-phosphate pyrophosphorylase n=2 Tax=Flavobacterium saliperosum TaxID=329186 RepID=A0A1G4V804_9FLAO|nr:thiamine phosphate synthase [Flavobacterium saliperosum]ESU28034.1 thiamine monophosphate synthase [Flavobacterium saliperosum S13]SCX02697.1 thiamine-phosphate pyrophosphorylase [Flavobacterium saliperosum]